MCIGKLTVIIASDCVKDVQFQGATFMVCRACDRDDLPGGEVLCAGPVDTREYKSLVCCSVETSSSKTQTGRGQRREDRREFDNGQVWGIMVLLTSSNLLLAPTRDQHGVPKASCKTLRHSHGRWGSLDLSSIRTRRLWRSP